MKRSDLLSRLTLWTLAVAPLLVGCSCDQGAQPAPAPGAAQPTSSTPPAAQAERTQERALQRARERWAKVEAKDLYAAYAYLAPEYQRRRPLQDELAQGANHEYSDAKVLEVVGEQDDQIFLRAAARWTPKHPILKQVHLDPGQSLDMLTQDIEIIEAWRWTGSDWFLADRFRPEEFAQAHPEVLKGGSAPQDGAGGSKPK